MLSAALSSFGCGGEDGELPPGRGQDEAGVTIPPDQGAGTTEGGTAVGPTPAPTSDGGAVQPPPSSGEPPTPSGDGGTSNPDAPGPGTTPPPTGQSGCLDGITDYAKAGPFKFASKNSGSVKMWVPEVPAGCKVPVVHLANGTGASCGNYRPVLERLASHGFLAACYESANTGAGKQGVMAIDTARTMFPDLVSNAIGSTGHSQGGQASFTVLQQAEAKWGDQFVYAGLAIEPASGFGDQPSPGPWQTVYGKIKSPMFMFSGTADILVSAGWVMQGFSALNDSIEAYNWSAQGATHIPVPNGETIEVSIPWFRWKLLGDQKACAAFRGLLMGGKWREVKAQNAKPCQ